eukprot:3952539-Pleurochrysis_carterae.AAC.1
MSYELGMITNKRKQGSVFNSTVSIAKAIPLVLRTSSYPVALTRLVARQRETTGTGKAQDSQTFKCTGLQSQGSLGKARNKAEALKCVRSLFKAK